MSDPATVQIGAETISLPPIMNFAQLERASPAIDAMATAATYNAQVAAAIALISCILLETRPDLTMPEIKRRVPINLLDGTDQRPGIWRAANDLIVASGLVRPGEVKPPADPAAPTDDPSANDSTSNTSSPA